MNRVPAPTIPACAGWFSRGCGLLLVAWSNAAVEPGLPPPIPTLAPPPPALPELTDSLFRLGSALTVVLTLFIGVVWLWRAWQRSGPGAPCRRERLRLLEVRSLGARQALYVVGYERERLLIASSPAGVKLLDKLPPAAEAEVPEVERPASFGESLRWMLSRR